MKKKIRQREMIREEEKHSPGTGRCLGKQLRGFHLYCLCMTHLKTTLISKCCFTLFALTGENTETVCAACTQLHHALEEGNMLGSKFKRRSILLKTLYKLVDVGSDSLSLKLAKIILAVSFSFLWSSQTVTHTFFFV